MSIIGGSMLAALERTLFLFLLILVGLPAIKIVARSDIGGSPSIYTLVYFSLDQKLYSFTGSTPEHENSAQSVKEIDEIIKSLNIELKY